MANAVSRFSGFAFAWCLALAVVVPSQASAQKAPATMAQATALYSSTDDTLVDTLMAAAKAGCVTPETREAMSTLVSDTLALLYDYALHAPATGFVKGRPGAPSMQDVNPGSTYDFWQQSLTKTLGRLTSLPTCVPPPPPTPVTQGPSGGGGGGGTDGGGSGGGGTGGGGTGGGGNDNTPPGGGDNGGVDVPLDPGQLTPEEKGALPCATKEELDRINEIQHQIDQDQKQLDDMEKAEGEAQDKATKAQDQEQERINHAGPGAQRDPQIDEQNYQLQVAADNLKKNDQPTKDSLNGEIRDLNQELHDLLGEIRARKRCAPQDKHSGVLQDILGHVSIGVGIGGHGDHGERGYDEGHDTNHDTAPSTPRD